MFNTLYQAIDWQAPWYQALATLTAATTENASVADSLNAQLPDGLTNAFAKPLKFVSQDSLPEGMAYESFIAQTGNIPTRDNFHDLLGGLIWLNFPKMKAVFNQLHEQDIAQYGIQAARSRLRNVLTLFDENGGVVVSEQLPVLQALQSFDWHTALWRYRDQWQHSTQFFPIGHALLEKMIEPRLGICAHCLLVQADRGFFELDKFSQRAQLDNWLSAFFLQHAANLHSKGFQPLPVLGIPEFVAEQDASFYQNTQVFRPKPTRKSSAVHQFLLK